MRYVKYLVWAALTLVASAAAAQNPDNRDRLSEIEQMTVREKKPRRQPSEFKKAGVGLLPEIGIGTHLVSSPDFRSQGVGSGQVYLHAVEAYVRPVSWMSLHVAGGIAWDRFRTRTSAFALDGDGTVLVRRLEESELDARKFRSSITESSVLIPVTLQFHAGFATFRLGAEAMYAFHPKVSRDLRTETDRVLTEKTGARIMPWSYDFLASVSFAGSGVFVKYQPAFARRFPQPSPSFSCWTLGYRFGF